MTEVIERFLRYVQIHTTSEESGLHPSADREFDLARVLKAELEELGAEDVYLDEQRCYVYAHIPATDPEAEDGETLGFVAHMDTSPDAPGEHVDPLFVENYQGEDIVLNREKDIILSPAVFPELSHYIGNTLIVTDGTTLLGADDKAGVAEIMTMASWLLTHPEIPHGRIAIAFTPDEEIGEGTDGFDVERFGADYAYTVDGGALGELEYENFNAASLKVHVRGRNVHPGEAKNKMVNAARIAMEYDRLLPAEQKPEYTEGYEGFFHLMHMEGGTDEAKLSYLIREHDAEKFHEKKALAEAAAEYLNRKYGGNRVEVEIRDSYYNMKEKIEPDHLFLIDRAEECMRALGIEPKVVPIRGGTDGANLSFMGVPCPNLCTGGHNFHGVYEYIPVESMEKITQLLIRLAVY